MWTAPAAKILVPHGIDVASSQDDPGTGVPTVKNDQRKHVWRMVAVLASLPAMLALAVLLLGVLDAPEEWAVVALHVVMVLWVLAYSLVFAGVARYVWGKLVGTTDIRRGAWWRGDDGEKR